jgi:hypothetical protein
LLAADAEVWMEATSKGGMNTTAAPEPLVIAYSRVKVALLLLGAAAAVAADFAFLGVSAILIQTPGHVAVASMLVVVALVTLAFFGPIAALGFAMLFDPRPGLVFDREGLTDRTTAIGVGFVPWSEVVSGRVIRTRSSRFLMVGVSDPRKYRRQGGWGRGFFSGANLRIYGTPISLSTITLSIGFDEMVAAFIRFHAHYIRPVV